MKIVTYFQGVWAELRKVTWPTAPAVLRSFLAVVVGVGLATLLIGAFDFAFLRLLGLIIN